MASLAPVADRPVGGAYRVDVSRGSNNGRVSSEWFSRPDDERFLSLTDLYASVRGRAERAETKIAGNGTGDTRWKVRGVLDWGSMHYNPYVDVSRDTTTLYTRVAARRHVERAFDTAVLAILDAVDLVDLRITVLDGKDDRPPAIAITCESMGQLDLGWIETGDAPIPWRAAAYALLDRTLGSVLPVFGYDDLFGEISAITGTARSTMTAHAGA